MRVNTRYINSSRGTVCTLYLHVCQVIVTIGNSVLCCAYLLILYEHSGPCYVSEFDFNLHIFVELFEFDCGRYWLVLLNNVQSWNCFAKLWIFFCLSRASDKLTTMYICCAGRSWSHVWHGFWTTGQCRVHVVDLWHCLCLPDWLYFWFFFELSKLFLCSAVENWGWWTEFMDVFGVGAWLGVGVQK